MWMGKTSAWMAVAFGLALLALTALHLSWDMLNFWTVAVGAALLLGAYRTLRGLSGGLRLLSGAWGFAAGGLMPGAATSAELNNPNLESVPALYGWIALSLPCIAIAGLALTVLHKER